MKVREIQFGEVTRPIHQSQLRPLAGETTQDRWIVVACRDKSFDVAVYQLPCVAAADVIDSASKLPYSRFWSTLSALALDDRKWWLIGWRLRYAFEKAGFVEALERGDVELPRIRSGKNAGKHTGKLTFSKRIFEVDLVAGANKIKVLDWLNFGVEPNAYCKSSEEIDADVATQALADFMALADAVDVAVCKPTSAQIGWYHARKIISNCTLTSNRDVWARQLERRAYHGGRNEAYRLGEIPGITHSLDVRSCYASICRDCTLPTGMIEEYRAGTMPNADDCHGQDHWIADVIVRTDTPDYPVRWQGVPIYPVGEFVTSLPWPELRHALRAGRVQRILRAARYQAAPALEAYAIWYLNARRRIGKEIPAAVGGALKGMFNASLGYTAREKYDWIPWECGIDERYWLGTTASPDDRQTAVSAQILDTEKRWLRVAGEPREAIPYLHATICSYARINLLELFKDAGRENILYCDTDGILCTADGRDRLDGAGRLHSQLEGSLSVRFTPGRAYIAGQKSYRVGSNWIQAGVPKSRYSETEQKRVPTSDVGRVDAKGKVWPFMMRCSYQEGRAEPWQNEMT